MYREYQPCGLLAPYVDKIWEFKGSPEYGMCINVLPDGCTDLIFALGGITQPVGNEGRIMPSCRSFFVGPMKRYSELVAYTETVHMVGIRFHPCGLFRFMDLPVQELGGQRISSADLGIKLFDDSFTERLYELPDLRSRIQCIGDSIGAVDAQARCSGQTDCFCGKPHSFVPRSAGDPFAGRRYLFVSTASGTAVQAVYRIYP